jgi:hypothetical protein
VLGTGSKLEYKMSHVPEESRHYRPEGIMDYETFPRLEDIYRRLDDLAKRHPELVRIKVLGKSAEGRDVLAVHVTDPDTPSELKQVAVVICGRHGNELGTRVVGPAVLEWLLSDGGVETRRRQQVVIVPVANPDGCVREEFHAPSRHLSELERNTIVTLVCAHRPDAIIDVHSFGESDADLQAIVTGNNSGEGEDLPIYHAVAARMIEAAARRGYPFLLHTEKRNEGYNNFIAGYCYDHFHTLAFGMEVNHHALTPQEAAESAVAVISALLSEGNARPPWGAAVGYPTGILKGDLFTSVRPAGRSAAERRWSRATIWGKRKLFYVGQRTTPDARTLIVAAGFSGCSTDASSCSFTLCCRLRGFPTTIGVRLNGREAEVRTFTDACSTFASVDIRPSGKEDYELCIEF